MIDARSHRLRWREYRTATGHSPVGEFIASLAEEDAAKVAAAMKDVALHGLISARHLRGDIYEVRAVGMNQDFRILFAREGRFHQVLLSLEGFSKKTQRTPPAKIALAEQRLVDWRTRGSVAER